MVKNYEQELKSYHDALRKLTARAGERNYFIDDTNILWCPVSIAEDAPKKPAGNEYSLHQFIRDLYMPDIGQDELPFSPVSGYVAQIVYFKKNEWIKELLEQYVHNRYELGYKKKSIALTPDECDLFSADLSADELLIGFALLDVFKIPKAMFDRYLYVPASNPSEKESQVSVVAKGQASGAQNFVSRKIDSLHFLYLDIGAWSSPQALDGTGHAPFGLITPNEVALWDFLAKKGTVTDGKGFAPGGMIQSFWNLFHRELPGAMVFYGHLRSNEGLVVVENDQRKTLTYKPYIPSPLTDNEMYVFIPDLHLHLFPGFAADNFIEPWPGGSSLITYLLTLFSYLVSPH